MHFILFVSRFDKNRFGSVEHFIIETFVNALKINFGKHFAEKYKEKLD